MHSSAPRSPFQSSGPDKNGELGERDSDSKPGLHDFRVSSAELRRPRRGARLGFRMLSLSGVFVLLSWAWRSAPPSLTRGPYLQNVTDRSLTLVCRTDTTSVVTLRYGEHAGPPWDFETSSPSGQVHAFALTGLRPETRYAYELNSGSSMLARGEPYFFRTAPPEESRAPFRFLAWGDSGTGSSTQFAVADRMEEVLPVPHFALGLGDLVYDSGDWNDYDPKLFLPYRDLLPHVTFWPTLGNHDVATENGAPYFDAFHLPTSTGGPGHPSNTERYYSFDHGMAHFTCADSELSSSSPGSAMYEWLEDDLADARARGKRWLIVYMHRPPYSHGTHDSDSESSLIELREDLVPLFEANDVDLVATGHSHVYERSFLARNDAVLQNHPNDYTKVASPDGTIYLVSGCGGKTGSGPLDHPLMARSYGDVAGFSLIDVSWEELRGSFVERDGVTTDIFTLHKATDVAAPRIAALEARAADQVALVLDEPVKDGTGASGAENLANYTIQPARAVLGATLQSDQRTVLLRTATLQPNRGYQLSVVGVEDVAGNEIEPSVTEGWFVLADQAASPPLAVLSTEVHTANVPARIDFSGARSSDNGGPLSSVRWDFGDGTAVVQGGEVEHLYDITGQFTVNMIVADAAGLESVARLPIRIHAQGNAPLAVLSSPSSAETGETVSFGSSGSRDPDGGAVFLEWDFGDPASGAANRSQVPAPTHVYATAGSYTVVLTVVDDEGSAVTDTAVINVGGSSQPPGTTFLAVADAQVRSSSPSDNFGSDAALRVRSGSPEYRSFVRFQVSGLTGSVTSARLRLFVTDGSDDGGSAYGVSATWSESAITWSNAPALGGSPLDSAGAVSAGTWAEYDVTAQVVGDGSYAFGLSSASENSALFSAREGSSPPELVIATGGPPPDTTPPQVTGRNPAAGATSVPATTNVTATFSEAVQGVSGSTFFLRRGTTSVAAQVSYDSATRTAVLDPTSVLEAGTTYTASLTNGIRDLADNPLAALSWSFTVAPPPPDVFLAVADAEVRSNSRNNNFGSAPALRVGSGNPEYRSFVRFQVSGLTGSVSSVRLRLFVTDASDDGGSAYGVSAQWGESTITWRNAPPIQGNPLDTAGPVSAGAWVEYDVTAHVAGNGSYAFGLTSASENTASFSSREGSDPPELVIQTSGL